MPPKKTAAQKTAARAARKAPAPSVKAAAPAAASKTAKAAKAFASSSSLLTGVQAKIDQYFTSTKRHAKEDEPIEVFAAAIRKFEPIEVLMGIIKDARYGGDVNRAVKVYKNKPDVYIRALPESFPIYPLSTALSVAPRVIAKYTAGPPRPIQDCTRSIPEDKANEYSASIVDHILSIEFKGQVTADAVRGRGGEDSTLANAAAAGHLETVRLLLAPAYRSIVRPIADIAALKGAIVGYHVEIVKLLLTTARQASAAGEGGEGFSSSDRSQALASAMSRWPGRPEDKNKILAQLEIVNALLDDNDAEIGVKSGQTIDPDDETAFKNKNVAMPVTGHTVCRMTPLNIAAGCLFDHEKIPLVFDRLVRIGFRVDIVDQMGRTPLHTAARVGDTHLVKHIVKHYSNVTTATTSASLADAKAAFIDINSRDKDCATPAGIACNFGQVEAARFLLGQEVSSDAEMNALGVAAGAMADLTLTMDNSTTLTPLQSAEYKLAGALTGNYTGAKEMAERFAVIVDLLKKAVAKKWNQ